MAIENQPLYQGRDWFSENWTVAQTYDALDKIHDVCLYQAKSAVNSSLFTDRLPLLSKLLSYMDLLHKGIAHVAEELIPAGQPTHTRDKGWLIFELQALEKEINLRLTELSNQNEHHILQEIITLTLAMKAHIRKLDQ